MQVEQLEAEMEFLSRFDPRSGHTVAEITTEQLQRAYNVIKRFTRRWVLKRRSLGLGLGLGLGFVAVLYRQHERFVAALLSTDSMRCEVTVVYSQHEV